MTAILLIANTFADWVASNSYDAIKTALSGDKIGTASLILIFPMFTLAAFVTFVIYFIRYGRIGQIRPKFTRAFIAKWVEFPISLPLLAFGIIEIEPIINSLSLPCNSFNCSWTPDSTEIVILVHIFLIVGVILFFDSFRNFGKVPLAMTDQSGTSPSPSSAPLPNRLPSQPTTPIEIYDHEQREYRIKLRDELIRLRQNLDDIKDPKEVPFPVWLCKHDPARRLKLIGNLDENNAIEKFITAVQARYDYQKTMNHIDVKFTKLNHEAIEIYDNSIEQIVVGL